MKKDSITIRALRRYHGYNPRYFPLSFLQTIFRNLSFFLNIWISAEIVNALWEGRGKKELYLLVTAALAGIFLVRMIAAILDREVKAAEEALSGNEAAAFYRKTLSLDYDKMENPDIRQLRRKIEENSWINSYGVINMRDNVLGLMDCIVNFAFSALLFWEMLALMAATPFRWLSLALVAALCGCLALAIVYKFWGGRKGAAYWDRVGAFMLQENRLSRGFSVSGMDNRIYRQQMIISRLYAKFNQEHKKVFSDVNRMDFRLKLPSLLFFRLTELCSYLIVCYYCTLGAFPVGSVLKYVGYLGRLMSCIGNFFGAFNGFKENEPFLKTYLEYFDIPNDMYQGSLAVEKRSDKRYDISFKNVSFRYAGSDAFALKDISLDLKVGERLAVVGMNGSGKTTFIKLLCRLYDPTQGEIFMNDFNIRKYDYRQYLDVFSVVFQDCHLLAVPLGNNVAGGDSWDQEKAEKILRDVGFGGRYGKMPKGLKTPIYKNFDSDGVEISGGEAQKIALARALYRNAPFIILDEPTAALDPIAEAEIYENFDRIVGDKTAIYISHRLSSCRFCDRIAVFHEGRIVQTGTHEELLEDKEGKYYELWHVQAQYYA